MATACQSRTVPLTTSLPPARIPQTKSACGWLNIRTRKKSSRIECCRANFSCGGDCSRGPSTPCRDTFCRLCLPVFLGFRAFMGRIMTAWKAESLGNMLETKNRSPRTSKPVAQAYQLLLDRMSQGGDAEKPSAKVSSRKIPAVVTLEVAEDDGDDKALTRSTQMKKSLEVTSKLWTRTGTSWSGLAFDSRSTSLKGDPAAPPSLSSKRSRQKKTSAFHNRAVQVQAYINWNQEREGQWLAALWLAKIFL